MIILRRVKGFEGFALYANRERVPCLQVLESLLYRGEVERVGVVDARTVLGATVSALSVEARWVYRLEVQLQE